ncbi:MAG: hypothetical protein WC490_01595 [Candidatus Margulisiibacteriota bacterium]
MKQVFVAVCACLILTGSSSFASQTTSLTGSTGLIRMPSGDVLKAKDWDLGIDYIFDNSSATAITSGTDLRGSWSYKANFGADMGPNNGLELGFVGRTEKVTNRFKEGVFINIKYGMASSNDRDALHMAIGVENLTSSLESDVYMVATKYFNSGLGLHFGAMFDFPDYNRFRPLGMLGITSPVGAKNLIAMAEAFAGESVFQLNAGLRYDLARSFSINVRGLNVTNSPNAKETQSFSAGICLTSPF